ncbi:pentapeptide repeat-containing protein [Aerosakkonema funiforme]|uniref:Pentapeptide repeat-containing protein n=1 Tax=Aerosakkonema funiforme FACHB-1375 TaxID=2949571 RepID=A0A926ZIB1_9CYAN|nr:pentapeptide repeat-containing protein [Aerosakkonema funiforme]MBD2184238.1 pentapeptide repeat-containing protein [Aerosakkonema funiforme FACHB-1375]
MTADEALEIVETALDYQHLNKVQELVFRQSWEGQSYVEIAKSTGYEPDYIKDAGAKLWKLLSKVLGEKVKKDNIKSVLKRYLRRNQVNLHRTQVIGVNFSGGTLTEANLSGVTLFASLGKADLCQADVHKTIIPDDNTKSDKEEHNQEIQSNSPEKIYYWNNLSLRSPEQVKIAEALDRANVIFITNTKVRLTSTKGKENKEADFLIFYQGKSGILVITRTLSQQDGGGFRECDRIFQSHGISIIQYYDAIRCRESPDRVVQEFLEILVDTAI